MNLVLLTSDALCLLDALPHLCVFAHSMQGSSNSYAIKKKDELERVAKVQSLELPSLQTLQFYNVLSLCNSSTVILNGTMWHL